MPVIDPFWREWRELWAARRLIRAIAYASSNPLLKPDAGSTPESRVEAVCAVVERHFDLLARLPGPDEAPVSRTLRGLMSQLTRVCFATKQEGRDKLLSNAAALWGDAVRNRRVREKLTARAHLFPEPGGTAKFQQVIKDALWEAETDSMVVTAQRRRKWKGLREVSLEILPSREQDGDRCTLAHFAAVAERVKKTRLHDNNLPRRPETVGEMFYLFCPCCVGVDDPRLPGYGGPVQHRGAGVADEGLDAPEEVETSPIDDEGIDVLVDVVPGSTASLVSLLRTATVALPLRDQVVLANLLQVFDIVSRAAQRAYPTLDAEVVKSRDRTAAALGLSWQELERERQRMDDWFGDVSRELQRDLLATRGTE